ARRGRGAGDVGLRRGALRRAAPRAALAGIDVGRLRPRVPDQGAAGPAAAAGGVRVRRAHAGDAGRRRPAPARAAVVGTVAAARGGAALVPGGGAAHAGTARLLPRRRGGGPHRQRRLRPPRRLVRLAEGLRADAAARHAALDGRTMALAARDACAGVRVAHAGGARRRPRRVVAGAVGAAALAGFLPGAVAHAAVPVAAFRDARGGLGAATAPTGGRDASRAR